MEDLARSVFAEVAVILMVASAVGLIGLALRQPLIVSFIVVGIVAGAIDVGSKDAAAMLRFLADLGVVALLFMVGLRLEIGLIRSLGAVAVTTGAGQVVITLLLGLLVCQALGFDFVTNIYVSVALTFASTIIVVKLLSDKREIETLHGRIALGILIIQDIVLIAVMALMSAVSVGAAESTPDLSAAQIIFATLLFMAFVAAFMRYGAEPMLRRMTTSPELLVSFAVGWAAVLAAVGDFVGLGKELGGLIAGVSLASTPYREAIASRLASLRDFLLLFFFVGLGASLNLASIEAQIVPAIVLSLFVLIGHPLIVIAIMGWLGYRRRTSFMTGLALAQISEFSLIFIAMGYSQGHIPEWAVGLVTVVGLVTIAISSSLITYSAWLYPVFERLLAPFERRRLGRHTEASPPSEPYDFVVLGFGRFGNAIAGRLSGRGARVLGVDFDPHALAEWQARGHDLQFGDIFDPDLPQQLPLQGVRWVVCAVPYHSTGLTHQDPRTTMLHSFRQHGYSGSIAAIAYTDREAQALRRAGADRVFMPFRDAAEHAAASLASGREES